MGQRPSFSHLTGYPEAVASAQDFAPYDDTDALLVPLPNVPSAADAVSVALLGGLLRLPRPRVCPALVCASLCFVITGVSPLLSPLLVCFAHRVDSLSREHHSLHRERVLRTTPEKKMDSTD